jgi:hypothetical protein
MTEKILLACTLLLLSVVATEAQAQSIYRCTKDGQVTLTDKACPGGQKISSGEPEAPNSIKSSAHIELTTPDVPEGAWHGSANLLLTVSDKAVVLSPQSNLLTIVVGSDESISGQLREQGCTLHGRITGSYSKAENSVVITLNGCRDTRLDLDYTGTLHFAARGQPAQLAISALSGYLTGKAPVAASLRANIARDQSTAPGAGKG